MTETTKSWRPDGYKVHTLCASSGCLNPARIGSKYCRPCAQQRSRGVPECICLTPGCGRQAYIGSNGFCRWCVLEMLEAEAAYQTAKAESSAPDPRIAKLEAVANDPAATDAERQSARNLIEKLRAR